MNEIHTKESFDKKSPAMDSGDQQRTDTSPQPTRSTGIVARIENSLLRRLLRTCGNPPVAFDLWDGRTIAADGVDPKWRVVVHDRRTMRKIALDPFFEFGEAYSEGRLEIVGDLELMLTDLYRRVNAIKTHDSKLHRLLQWVRRPRSNTLAQSRDNIFHHYDIGNDFYQLWLDERLVYTCAYFAEPSMTLEEAQLAKMDHVCRKLRLQPGQVVFEAGCGWGALALHMAKHYGVRVKAVNISREQIDFACQRCEREGLSEQVEFRLEDWRSLTGKCDVFVSVGMLEHLGVKNYELFGKIISDCLDPQGLALIHTIGQVAPRPVNAWTEKRIFPGGYPPALSEITKIFEPHDFSVLDVENLRFHYAETLRHWTHRYEQSLPWVIERFDERFSRMWRLYLVSSIAAFQGGSLELFQIVFSKVSNELVPLTRDDIYGAREPQTTRKASTK